jgi:Protein of unknown function (DUF3562)
MLRCRNLVEATPLISLQSMATWGCRPAEKTQISTPEICRSSAWDSIRIQRLGKRNLMHELGLSPNVPSKTDTPVDAVRELYRVEREKLEHSARIKTFVPVLARRRVKELLLVHRGLRH